MAPLWYGPGQVFEVEYRNTPPVLLELGAGGGRGVQPHGRCQVVVAGGRNSSRSIIGNVVCRTVVRIGFVGTGVIAWAHAIGIEAMIRADVVDASVVAVHDLDVERAAGFAAVNGPRSSPAPPTCSSASSRVGVHADRGAPRCRRGGGRHGLCGVL